MRTRNQSTEAREIDRMLVELDGQHLRRPEVAALLKIPVMTLTNWETTAGTGPSFVVAWGRRFVYLYTPDDVARVARHRDRLRRRGQLGVGAKPIWTAEERLARHRNLMRAVYYQRKARQAWAAGEDEVASRYQVRLTQVREHLGGQLTQRKDAIRSQA